MNWYGRYAGAIYYGNGRVMGREAGAVVMVGRWTGRETRALREAARLGYSGVRRVFGGQYSVGVELGGCWGGSAVAPG
jgi:hypothetical protein